MSDSNSNHQLSSAEYGPLTLDGLQMTLRSAKEVLDWQYLTAIYEQSFYNDAPLGQDYIQNTVYNFATALEVTEIR